MRKPWWWETTQVDGPIDCLHTSLYAAQVRHGNAARSDVWHHHAAVPEAVNLNED